MAAAVIAGAVAGPVPAAAPAAAAPQAAAAHIAAPGQRVLVGLKGSPHTWLVDEQGVLHWVGDSAALLKGLYAGREYTLSDPLDETLERTLNRPQDVAFADLLALRRGEPWLSTSFVALDGAVYLARWEAFEDEPTLLRVQSPAELELFGVTGGNYGTYVLAKEAWEQRFRRRVDDLELGELRPVAPPPPTPPPCLPVVEDVALEPERVTVRVRNACGTAQRLGLSAVIYDAEGGQPLAATDAATWHAPPGEAQVVVLQGGSSGGTWALPLRNAAPAPAAPAALPESAAPTPAAPAAADALLCVPVGPGPCLQTDPWLRQAVEVLLEVEHGQRLLETAADFGVVLRRADLDDALGRYRPASRTVVLARALDAYSDWERTVVLAHELRHAADHAAGTLLLARTPADCLAREHDAFRSETEVWLHLWKAALPAPRHGLQEHLNESAVAVQRDPLTVPPELKELYRTHCRIRDRRA